MQRRIQMADKVRRIENELARQAAALDSLDERTDRNDDEERGKEERGAHQAGGTVRGANSTGWT